MFTNREKEKDRYSVTYNNSTKTKKHNTKYGSKEKDGGSVILNSIFNLGINLSNVGYNNTNHMSYINNYSYNKKFKSPQTHNSTQVNNFRESNNVFNSNQNNLNYTNTENNFYCKINVKITNFDQILMNALHSTNNNLMNSQHYHSSCSIIDNSVVYPSPKISKRKSNKLESIFMNTNLIDLYNYFVENNLNVEYFLEIFGNIDKILIQGKEVQNSYGVFIIKSKYLKLINRECIEKIDDIESNRSYLFIIEGGLEEIEKFIVDVFVFTEALGNHDELSLVTMVTNRKIEETKENMEVIGLNKINNANDSEIMNQNFSNKKKVLFQCVATRILPEKYQNGVFVLLPQDENKQENKQERRPICEFIPINNNPNKCSLKINSNDIMALVKYRFLYQYKAVNIILHKNNESILMDFENEECFNIIYEYLKENSLKLDKVYCDIKYHTNMWVDGLISNFDYLMYLNTMSGRSYDDLSQYPIMPWVISNYDDETLDLNDVNNFRDLSKPIGALNLKRLKSLRDNYNELKDQGKDFPYLYGTYYSFPYIIFYYLIRSHPVYFLRFQGGSYGPTDRLFFSIKECWNNSLKNPGSQDVKELIPEFYNSDGEFLKNISSLNFGKTQNNHLVDDVVLPKWASSGKDFINIMRSALESEIVSSNLNHWIDLVFGYKQRGDKALEADNLFHHLRYDDKYHLISEKSDEERQGDIDNIFEFGQIPIQLFTNDPHPKKRSKISVNDVEFDNLNKQDFSIKVYRLKKERIIIEKRYEKERRQKESEIEEIQKKLDEKLDEFQNQVDNYNELISNKQIEFTSYLTSLLEKKNILKNSFSKYDENKDKVYKEWIKSIKVKHDKEIELMFEDKPNLYKYIKELEHISDNYKSRNNEIIKNIDYLNKDLQNEQKEEKLLKEEIFSLHKKIRNLPYDKQIYLNKNNNVRKDDFINIRKIIKDIK